MNGWNDDIGRICRDAFDRYFRPLQAGSWEGRLERFKARKAGVPFDLDATNRLRGFIAWKAANKLAMDVRDGKRPHPDSDAGGELSSNTSSGTVVKLSTHRAKA